MPLALTTVFADLPDPRRETKNKLHHLTDILVIATCAVIAGADGWDQVAEYGRRKEAFFRRFLALPNGIPSHDTFDRVFAKLDPDAFADRFGRWAAEACEGAGLVHVAIDGKSARRSKKGTFTGCLHLVEAWAVEDRLLLGVRSVPDGGHEITTIPELVAGLDLTGAVVTIDAAGCQKATVDRVRARGGEYVVCVKGNQKGLRDAVAALVGSLTVVGFVLVSSGTHIEIGDFAMLGAVLLGCMGYVGGARMSRQIGSWQTICWANVISAPILLIPVIWSAQYNNPNPSPQAWLAFGYLGVFSMFLGFFAWYRGLALGGIARISQIQLIQAFLSIIWAGLLLNEVITPGMWVAVTMVIACIFVARKAPIHAR